MHPVGFEPTLPKKLRPERSALDHSAKNAQLCLCKYMYEYGSEPQASLPSLAHTCVCILQV